MNISSVRFQSQTAQRFRPRNNTTRSAVKQLLSKPVFALSKLDQLTKVGDVTMKHRKRGTRPKN